MVKVVSSSLKDFKMMGEILLRIFQKSNALWTRGSTLEGNKIDDTTLYDYRTLLSRKPLIALGKLENLIKKPRYHRLLLGRPFNLYLPPLSLNKEFVPILSMDWKLNKAWIEISIRIEMYRYCSIDGSRSHLRSIGFRFEIHKPGTPHDYMHVQVTSRFGQGVVEGCPDWLPTSVPCIPTIAKGPISLLFCILVSLYGKEMYSRLFSGMNLPQKYKKPLKDIIS